MMVATDLTIKSATLEDYRDGLSRSGMKTVSESPEWFWVQYERFALVRFPTILLEAPSKSEIRRVLWSARAAIAGYNCSPGTTHAANAYLYTCSDKQYHLDKLDPAARRNVRRGLRELEVESVSAEQLLSLGANAYCDTRRRAGLTDGTPDAFRRRIHDLSDFTGRAYLGAWRDDQLAAYLSISAVNDWAEVELCSADKHLDLRPNDALLYTTLHHLLVEKNFRVVSFGVSSLQSESNVAGLHRFKTKLGFDAKPIHRAFVFHPVLRPFANRLTLLCLNAARHIHPASRPLRKASGLMNLMLNQHLPPVGSDSESESSR